jgi:hypothetical protein
MVVPEFEILAKIRTVVGYLGEREQQDWWQSSFFAANSRTFLSPVFGRTHLLARCIGVTRAAALVHDERIGVGRVYHLFRLPEDVEQGIHLVLHTAEVMQQVAPLVAQQDAAMQFLDSEARSLAGGNVGPAEVGHARDVRDRRYWRAVAAQYLHAFEARTEVYPYFTDRL